MYIIVVGGGRVGYYLGRALLDEGHEVLILEKKARFCEIINEEMGSVCVQGDGCEAATLAEVGTSRADMLVAVSGDDEDNLVACQVAKHKFNVPRTIAKIKNPRNETLFKKLGIDATVSSTDLILAHIEHELPFHPLIPLLKLKGGDLRMMTSSKALFSMIAGTLHWIRIHLNKRIHSGAVNPQIHALVQKPGVVWNVMDGTTRDRMELTAPDLTILVFRM